MIPRRKGTPRHASTYRAARRNAARSEGLLHVWKAKTPSIYRPVQPRGTMNGKSKNRQA